MPIPIVIGLWALAGAAAAGGAGAGAKGMSDKSKAKKLDGASRRRYDAERAKYKREVKALNTGLSSYAESKIVSMNGPMSTFARYYGRLSHINFDKVHAEVPLVGKEEATAMSEVSFDALEETLRVFRDLGVGLGVGQAASAGTTFAVANFAAASTGAMIGELTGAAATNATLAYLGGGSLAVGGGGVAAGTALLTGVAASPILLVGGGMMWYRANQALNGAKAHQATVDAEIAKMRRDYAKFNRLGSLAADAKKLLEVLSDALRDANREFGRITKVKTDFRKLTTSEKERVAVAASLARAIRTLVDTPIATNKGVVNRVAATQVQEGLGRISKSDRT